jgi:hypothetical protein
MGVSQLRKEAIRVLCKSAGLLTAYDYYIKSTNHQLTLTRHPGLASLNKPPLLARSNATIKRLGCEEFNTETYYRTQSKQHT